MERRTRFIMILLITKHHFQIEKVLEAGECIITLYLVVKILHIIIIFFCFLMIWGLQICLQ